MASEASTRLQQFATLLEDEREAIASADPERLTDIAKRKQALAGELSRLRDGLRGDDARDLLERCRRLNQDNAAAVQAGIIRLRTALAVLQGEPQPQVYSADGSLPARGRGGRILGQS